MTDTRTADRMIVVVASAGGVEALKNLVADLPEDLPAAVVVALHLTPSAPSLLPEILQRRTRLTVVAAREGLVPTVGTVVVARPDVHLIVEDGHVRLGRGAAENGHRPSHDVTLRSAALAYGPRLVGVVLTGLLDDGAVGLGRVARYGGVCLVQDPDEAEFDAMPRAALRSVPGAARLTLADLPAELDRLVRQPVTAARSDVPDAERADDLAEVASGLADPPLLPDGSHPGRPSAFGCPECHGVLNQLTSGPDGLRFRCRTGHAWTARSLLTRQDRSLQEALWVALRVLEERAELSRRLAKGADGARPRSRQIFESRAQDAAHSAEVLRNLLTQVTDETDGRDATGPEAARSDEPVVGP